MKQDSPSTDAPIRILKIASCPSLSGNSTLTYHLGCNAESEILFRVFANSGNGLFSNQWVTLSAIQKVFAKVPEKIALTAHLLSSLFQGKSSNTWGFLFAVLKHEGVVGDTKDDKGFYRRIDPSKFLTEAKKLIAARIDLKVEERPLSRGTQGSPAIPKPIALPKSVSGVKVGLKKSPSQGKHR